MLEKKLNNTNNLDQLKWVPSNFLHLASIPTLPMIERYANHPLATRCKNLIRYTVGNVYIKLVIYILYI